MSWNPDDNLSDSDDEEEDVELKGREAYIFVVDALLYPKRQLFEDCLGVIHDAFLNGLLTRGKDLIGMVFNNTEHSPPPKDTTGMENIVPHKNTAVFLPLRTLSKEAVDYYLNFQDNDNFDFVNRYGSQEGNFANMLWLCTNMFQQCGYKLSMPAIIYFTDRETPHQPGTTEYQQALQKAKDLNEINVDFTVCPMTDEFNYDVFYKEFFCTVTDTDLESFNAEAPHRTRTVIANRLIRKNFQTHCKTYLRWKIGEGVSLAVGVYSFYQRNVYPRSVKLTREDNALVETKRVWKLASLMDLDVEERVALPSEQRKLIQVGNEKIYFTNEELHKMKTPMPAGIQLLGFKPSETLKLDHFLKSADFLYPNEKNLGGSCKLFRALWEKCRSKNKIAICVLVARRNSSPQYVALIPMASEDSESHISGMCQEGFHIWYFPCHSDFRPYTFPTRPSVEDSDDDMNLMTRIIKKLRIKYTPESLRDPALNALRADIVNVAFDIETRDSVDLNSLECMGIDEERLNQVVESFKNDLQLIESDPEQENVAQKRRQPAGQSQRSKVPRADGPPTREQIDSHIENGTLDKLTVKDLREYLQGMNVKGISSATKAVLIQKITDLHI